MTLERFHFKAGDKDFTLPKQIPAGALRKARNLDPLDQIFTILEEVADTETLAAIDSLSVQELTVVARDWMQGLSAGESSSSPS